MTPPLSILKTVTFKATEDLLTLTTETPMMPIDPEDLLEREYRGLL